MEHTSAICNMIDKTKHLKSAFIHEIEKPATMKMPIWNAQQMAPRQKYELLQKAPDNTKKASKGWIRDEDQYQGRSGRMKCRNPNWMMPHLVGMLKLLNNSAMLPKVSNHPKKYAN
jgi:hypothetical protein